MIYLDHGATSFPKPKGVIEEMEKCMRYYCGNPGRSGHQMSLIMGEKIYEARRELAAFIGVEDPSRLLFTKNTTESLNLVLQGCLQDGDHVVTTSMEHNSVLRPLKVLEEKGITHTIVKGDRQGKVSAGKIKDALKETTRLIVVTGASNVTGTKMPIKEISEIAREKGIPILVDGAQCIGKVPLNIASLGISYYAFPGHKGLMGPPGTGGLYVADGAALRPLLYGGTGTMSQNVKQPLDFPEGFEAGTANGPGLIGLSQSIKVLKRIGVETIAHQERELISFLEEYLRNMNQVICYGPAPEEKTGICLFNIKGMESEEVTEALSRRYNIAVRGGYHCAGLAHKTIGTEESGGVRISVGPFNTRKEMKQTAEAIWHLCHRI